MSATANLAVQDDTFYHDQNNDDNMYREGPAKTNCEPLDENIKFKARSARVSNPVIDLRKPREDIKQIWNGVVTEFNDQEFTVRLEDKINPENPDELVVLSIDEIDDRDKHLINVGAMLLWHIGYRYGPNNPRERFSKIAFRRLPRWTEEEIQGAEQLAKGYADFFLANTDDFT